MSIWIFFKIIGSLALLIYGMKAMSEALQKMAGSQLRHILGTMTKNRFTGLLTGMFVTASVQSSTATTVMTVSFVNAGLLTLAQAISVIMGANIGTTFTAWIMTLGFSFNMANIVFPVFFIALLLIYRKKHRYVGDFLFGVAAKVVVGVIAVGVVVFNGNNRGGDGNVAANFFGVIIADGVAIGAGTHALDCTGHKQQALSQGSLPAAAVAHQTDVSDVLHRITHSDVLSLFQMEQEVLISPRSMTESHTPSSCSQYTASLRQ